MFHLPTLVVVGAGASAEINMPTGDALAAAISTALDFKFDSIGHTNQGDKELFECIRLLAHTEAVKQKLNQNERLDWYIGAAGQISRGVRKVNSIDNFIDMHRGDDAVATIGKLAIAHLILRAERNSRIFYDTSRGRDILPFESSEGCWLPVFAELIFRGATLDDLSTVFDNVEVICFNYDRSLERYLAFHIDDVFGIGLPTARQLVAKLKVFRPYGWLGTLQAVPFGHQASIRDLPAIGNSIRTYSERVQSEAAKTGIADMVDRCQVVAFLGFGYHRQNMDLLHARSDSRRNVFATALGIPDVQIDLVRRKLEVVRPDIRPVIDKKGCQQFLREYGPLMGVE